MNATEIQELRAKFRGELIAPGDAGYDAARKVYNGMIDRRPALIVKCADVADVIAGVNLAREKKLLLAVRGGGHNGPGLGVCDDGLVIDLSRLKGIRVDQKDKHGAGRRRVPLGRRGPRDPPVRAGRAERLPLDDRRGRPDAGRRDRLSQPQVRPDDRQPARRGRRPRGRPPGHGQRRRRTRTSSGPCAAAAATSAS